MTIPAIKLEERSILDWDAIGIKRPYDLIPGTRPGGVEFVIETKERWDAYQWNPPQYAQNHYPEPDPAASPKPTYEQVLLALRYGRVRQAGGADWTIRESEGKRAEVLNSVPLFGPDVHAGPIERMTGLFQMVEHANIAGNDIPHIVMRDGEHRRSGIHTQAAVRGVLEAVAARKNLVESAHNVLVDKYYAHARIRDDEQQPLEDRERAAVAAQEIADNYQALLTDEIARYDPNAMPADLPTIIEVYTERLEAVATGQQKAIKSGLTQQAVDNWATCVDQDKALTEIARLCTLGVIDIQGAADTFYRRTDGAWVIIENPAEIPAQPTDADDFDPPADIGNEGETYQQFTGKVQAEIAFAKAKHNILTVVAANVPTWDVQAKGDPMSVHLVHGARHDVKGHTGVVVNCKQIIGVEGKVAQSIPKATYPGGRPAPVVSRILRRPSTNPTWHIASVDLVPGETLPVTVRFRGMNLCGHSEIVVTITPPAPTP